MFFRQKNTDVTAQLLIHFLEPYFDNRHYVTFRADGGGVGAAIIDQIEKVGWQIQRTHNQSPAFNKTKFLNLGAELWHHMKRLIEKCVIQLPPIDKLRLQLTSRNMRGLDSTQGKFALESKPEARAAGRPSPDRADAFVLCFSSYHPSVETPIINEAKLATAQDLLDMYYRGWPDMEKVAQQPEKVGTFTWQTGD